LGAGMQHLGSEKRNQREAVHREQREHGQRDEKHPDHGLVPGVRRALGQPGEHRLLVVGVRDVGQASHQEQGGHRAEVAERVGEEAQRDADQGDQHTRDRRSDDSGAIEDR